MRLSTPSKIPTARRTPVSLCLAHHYTFSSPEGIDWCKMLAIRRRRAVSRAECNELWVKNVVKIISAIWQCGSRFTDRGLRRGEQTCEPCPHSTPFWLRSATPVSSCRTWQQKLKKTETEMQQGSSAGSFITQLFTVSASTAVVSAQPGRR